MKANLWMENLHFDISRGRIVNVKNVILTKNINSFY